MLPDFTPEKLRQLLRRAARPVETPSHGPVPVLTVQAAVAEARQGMIRTALVGPPCSLQTLAAITGLELRLARDVLTQLEAEGAVRHLTRGRLERYELIAGH
jgi:hypothetical protein